MMNCRKKFAGSFRNRRSSASCKSCWFAGFASMASSANSARFRPCTAPFGLPAGFPDFPGWKRHGLSGFTTATCPPGGGAEGPPLGGSDGWFRRVGSDFWFVESISEPRCIENVLSSINLVHCYRYSDVFNDLRRCRGWRDACASRRRDSYWGRGSRHRTGRTVDRPRAGGRADRLVSAGAPGAQRGVPLTGRCPARPFGGPQPAGRGVLAVPVGGRRAAGRSRPLAGVGWTPGGWRQVRGPRGGEASRSARRPVRGAPPPGWRAGRASRASGRSRPSSAVRALEGGPRADRCTTAVRPTFRRAKQGQRPGPSSCVGPCEARRAGPERAAQPPKNGGRAWGLNCAAGPLAM